MTDIEPSPEPAKDVITGALDEGVVSEDSSRLELAGATAMIEEAEGLLGDVEAALERLESGHYRSCEICGAPLEAATLTAEPTLRRCLVHSA